MSDTHVSKVLTERYAVDLSLPVFNLNDHLTTLHHQSGVYIDNNPAADKESSNMKRRKCKFSSEI